MLRGDILISEKRMNPTSRVFNVFLRTGASTVKEKKASSSNLRNGRMRSDRFVEHLYIKADLKFRL